MITRFRNDVFPHHLGNDRNMHVKLTKSRDVCLESTISRVENAFLSTEVASLVCSLGVRVYCWCVGVWWCVVRVCYLVMAATARWPVAGRRAAAKARPCASTSATCAGRYPAPADTACTHNQTHSLTYTYIYYIDIYIFTYTHYSILKTLKNIIINYNESQIICYVMF